MGTNCRNWRYAIPLGLSLVLLSGCLTQGLVYDDLRSARQKAYEEWSLAREKGDIPIPAEHLTLDESIRIALLYNKRLQAKVLDREIARGQLRVASQSVLPRFDLSASTSVGTHETDHARIAFRQPLFRGGGATAAMRAARLFTYWSDEDVRHTVQDVIRLTAMEYYAALLAENLCDVNRDAVTSAVAHLKDVRVKRANGVASKYDELRAQVDVANFQAELIRQENNLVLAKNSLLRTLGTATDVHITMSDHLRHLVVGVELEDAIRIAYANRPDILKAELDIRMQRESIRVLHGRYLPEIDLALSADADRARDGDDRWHGAQRAAIEFNWNLFDGLGREGELIVAKARFEQSRIALKQVEEDVFLDTQQALLNLKNAEKYVESQQLNLQHAQEGLRLAMTGYREGVNTEVEIVDARSALTEARGNYYRALFDHSMARLSLTHAMGLLGKGGGVANVEPLIPPQADAPPSVKSPTP